jgi:hypothetical protein
MKLTDRFAEMYDERREEMARRAELSREELARRAQDIREQFAERVDRETVTSFAGWTLVSTGIAWGVTDWLRGQRGLRSLIFPIGLIVLGTAVLGGGAAWTRRAEHIGEAEMRVREELAGLDPFARMRVLRDVGEESMPFVRRLSAHN